MGCRVAKPVQTFVGDERDGIRTATTPTTTSLATNVAVDTTTTATMPQAAEAKARLERLMCIARETPEPVFELSACALKTVPAGVFILCRVLRKELLDLSRNRLRSLADGGQLNDLALLTHLDLSGNQFVVLPEALTQLVNLKELHVSKNRLGSLPAHLNRLHRLELLDASHNQLQECRAVACMPALRVLNVSGNPRLRRLPMELSTCDSLVDVVCDAQTIDEPPAECLEHGTAAMLAYLAGDVDGWRTAPRQQRRPVVEMAVEVREQGDSTGEDRANDETDAAAELACRLQLDQQRARAELLRHLRQQQTDSDALVSELQTKRDENRTRLIEDISQAEAHSSLAVDRLLRLRSSIEAAHPDVAAAAEREQREQLETLRTLHAAQLQRSTVLGAMAAQLSREHEQIAAYAERRGAEHGELMRHIEADEEKMERAIDETEWQRSAAVERICGDERLQRDAVAALMERGDSHSWALVEQVRMIEAELQRMTRAELQRRQFSADEQMNKLSEQRMDLSALLVDLMDQQDRRKQQLISGLQRMQAEQQDRQSDFWLLQYQKLLDARPPSDLELDPRLGLQLLTHGVVHLLPFLSGLLRTSGKVGADGWRSIDDGQLAQVGVRSAAERVQVLRAIEAYYAAGEYPLSDARPDADGGDDECGATTASAEASAPPPTRQAEETVTGLAECVVCMERASKVIFLPCGHLCCCSECQEPLSVCPMCRGAIERRIRVIQATN